MDPNWLSFWIGIGSSLVSTAVIAFSFLIFCRPSIKISPNIAKSMVNGNVAYFFKFINSSIIFQASEVICDVTCVEPTTGSSGTTLTHLPITFKKSSFQIVPRKNNKETSDFAIWMGTYDDLPTMLRNNPSCYFLLKIKAKNMFSGLSQVFEQKFNIADIYAGEHAQGCNLNIVTTRI